jgi:hypothetical protein
MGTGGSFPEVKLPVGEADHSPSSGAEVKNAWSYAPNRPYGFMAWFLINRRIFIHSAVLKDAQYTYSWRGA